MAWEENSRICLHMQLIAILSRIEVIFNSDTCHDKFFCCPIVNDAAPTIATYFSRSNRSSIFPPDPISITQGLGEFFFYQISTEFVRLGIFTDVLKPSGLKGVCR